MGTSKHAAAIQSEDCPVDVDDIVLPPQAVCATLDEYRVIVGQGIGRNKFYDALIMQHVDGYKESRNKRDFVRDKIILPIRQNGGNFFKPDGTELVAGKLESKIMQAFRDFEKKKASASKQQMRIIANGSSILQGKDSDFDNMQSRVKKLEHRLRTIAEEKRNEKNSLQARVQELELLLQKETMHRQDAERRLMMVEKCCDILIQKF